MLDEQNLVYGSWNVGNLDVYVKHSTDIYEICVELPEIKHNKAFLNFLSCGLGCVEIISFCPETWKSYLVVNFKYFLNHKFIY